jgi:hypothetical protein
MEVDSDFGMDVESSSEGPDVETLPQRVSNNQLSLVSINSLFFRSRKLEFCCCLVLVYFHIMGTRNKPLFIAVDFFFHSFLVSCHLK